MKKPITVFDRATGEVRYIQRIDFGTEPIVLPPDVDWIEGAVDGSMQLVDIGTRQPVDKPEMAITVTGNVLDGIPVGAVIIANLVKDPEPIDDGDYELVVDHPQTVHVSLQHPLYLTWEGEIACAP